MNIRSDLWILMAWCFSISSYSAEYTDPCVSSYSWVNNLCNYWHERFSWCWILKQWVNKCPCQRLLQFIWMTHLNKFNPCMREMTSDIATIDRCCYNPSHIFYTNLILNLKTQNAFWIYCFPRGGSFISIGSVLSVALQIISIICFFFFMGDLMPQIPRLYPTTVLSPNWDFLAWSVDIFKLNDNPVLRCVEALLTRSPCIIDNILNSYLLHASHDYSSVISL